MNTRAPATLNPLTSLVNAIQTRVPVRIVLRRHTETETARIIEAWPQRVDPSPKGGHCVVLTADRSGQGDAARWVIHLDRVAMVEPLAPDALGHR